MNRKLNKKSTLILTAIVFSIIVILNLPPTYAEIVSLTVDLQTILLEPNQIIPLLDTRSIGNMSKLQVSATLPCDGNNVPKLKIVTGALGNLTGVIDSSNDYKNLRGAFNGCYYEDVIAPKSNLPILNKVFLKNDGTSSVVVNLGSVVTLTANIGNQTTSTNLINTSELLAYYTFEEDPTDTLTNHCSQTSSTQCVSATGVPQSFVAGDRVAGKLGLYAWNFDNTDNTVSLSGGLDDRWSTTGQSTVAFWANIDTIASSPDVDYVLGQYDSPTVRRGYSFQPTNFFVPSVTYNNYASTTASADQVWHFWVVTFNNGLSTKVKIYKDGQLVADGGTTNEVGNLSSNFYIGTLNGGSYPLDGRLDDMSIWSRELTQTEVQQLYNNGAGLKLVP